MPCVILSKKKKNRSMYMRACNSSQPVGLSAWEQLLWGVRHGPPGPQDVTSTLVGTKLGRDAEASVVTMVPYWFRAVVFSLLTK